jgi:hypothetical protein
MLRENVNTRNTDCFKKSFTTLNAYINVFRGYVQCFELLYLSNTYQVSLG